MRTRGRGAGGGGGGRRKCAVARFLFAARLVTTIVILGTFGLAVVDASSSDDQIRYCNPGWWSTNNICSAIVLENYALTKVDSEFKESGSDDDRRWTLHFTEMVGLFYSTEDSNINTTNIWYSENPQISRETYDPPQALVGITKHWDESNDKSFFMLSFRKLGQGWTVDECTWSAANGMKEKKSWPNDSKETSGGGPYVAFGMQRVSSNYCWTCDDDASYNFMFCKVNPPPPPPPPPSPPPSPPPPGGFPIEKPTVEIKNKVKFVSDAEVDFDIRVKDSDGCMNGENDCFAFASYDTNKRRGLYCKVRVCGEEVEEAARDSLPTSKYLSKDSCKKWDNFYDDSKRGVHKKFLTTIKDDEGNLAQGTYTISYTCGWKKKTGQYLEGSVVSSPDFHTFTMVEG